MGGFVKKFTVNFSVHGIRLLMDSYPTLPEGNLDDYQRRSGMIVLRD